MDCIIRLIKTENALSDETKKKRRSDSNSGVARHGHYGVLNITFECWKVCNLFESEIFDSAFY